MFEPDNYIFTQYSNYKIKQGKNSQCWGLKYIDTSSPEDQVNETHRVLPFYDWNRILLCILGQRTQYFTDLDHFQQ